MIGGQCIDLANEDKSNYSLDEILKLNETGKRHVF